jgi:prepilin signal peptidase PulO-like enzyme (type II secretory pathway)
MLHQFTMGTERGLLVVVSFLLLVQGPLDLLTSRLLRPLTSGGFIATVVIVLVDAVVMVTLRRALVAALLCALVMAAFGVLHRVSSKSLGFGDVLLVGPLSLAIGYVSPSNTPLWLLAASVSGALHGVMSRVIRKSITIPFGPHLLGAAWLTLVLSV